LRAPFVPASTTNSVRPATTATHGPDRFALGIGPPAPHSATCNPSGRSAIGSPESARSAPARITRVEIGPHASTAIELAAASATNAATVLRMNSSAPAAARAPHYTAAIFPRR
jgi:hypothetical protein